MTTPKEFVTEFLQSKGLLKPNYTEFVITMEDGKQFELVKVLQEFYHLTKERVME